MRVIAGSARGRELRVPPSVTRPTMDKVRGGVFSSLGDFIIDAVVLDLFAGSGAFGIEALSRGSDQAVFVESDRLAARVIRENLIKAQVEDRARIVTADVYAWLKQAFAAGQKFDLIFADPPYLHPNGGNEKAGGPPAIDYAEKLIATLDDWRELLQPQGILMVEAAKTQDPAVHPSLDFHRELRYGKSKVISYLPRPQEN